MTPIEATRALAKFLQQQFAEMDFMPTDEKTANNKITVRDGFLPRRNTAREKQTQDPCVLIRPIEIIDDENGSTVKMQILIVTYNSDMNDGHLELYHILECIRRFIEQTPILERRFMLNMPLKTLIPEEQPWPEWWAYMEVTYTIGRFCKPNDNYRNM